VWGKRGKKSGPKVPREGGKSEDERTSLRSGPKKVFNRNQKVEESATGKGGERHRFWGKRKSNAVGGGARNSTILRGKT